MDQTGALETATSTPPNAKMVFFVGQDGLLDQVATKTRVSPAWMLERSDDRELPKLQVTHNLPRTKGKCHKII